LKLPTNDQLLLKRNLPITDVAGRWCMYRF